MRAAPLSVRPSHSEWGTARLHLQRQPAVLVACHATSLEIKVSVRLFFKRLRRRLGTFAYLQRFR